MAQGLKVRQEQPMAPLTPHLRSLASWRIAYFLIWHISKSWGQNCGSMASSVIFLHRHPACPQYLAASSHPHRERMAILCFTFMPAGIGMMGKLGDWSRLQPTFLSSEQPSLGQWRLSPCSGVNRGGENQRDGWYVLAAPGTCFFFPQVMVPSLDDIQQAINRMIQLTLEVSRGVAHWGQQQTRQIKPVINSPSRTTTDLAHPSTGKPPKKEDSKSVKKKSQINRILEL